MAAGMLRAHEEATGASVSDHLRIADTHWSRLKGLLGTPRLEPGDGLWIRPCRQVHMLGMRYPIDVAFLDGEQRVVRTLERLEPGRISPKVREAESALELPVGTVARTGLGVGTRIAIEGQAGRRAETRAAAIRSVVLNVLLAAVYLQFAGAHLSFGWRTGAFAAVLPLVAQEALLVVLFLARRQSIATSDRPVDWAVGIMGTVLPLLMRATPVPGPLDGLGTPLQMLGLVAAVLGLASLGRSVGVVAANRGIKTGGFYRFVRHPMYGAYLVTYLGYVCSHPSPLNLLIVAVTAMGLRVRAVAEERFLTGDPAYRDFLDRTRWRLVPGVY